MIRRFFVETTELSGSTAIISGSDARHIKNVLRLKPGDKIELFDGVGTAHAARIVSFFSKQVKVELLNAVSSTTESPVNITVAQAYLKEKKMDSLLRQLTELGIAAWMPFVSARSVPKPDLRRLEARKERWRKIAQESLKQCRRDRIPQIDQAASFETILERGQTSDLKIIFWENESRTVHSLHTTAIRQKQIKNILLILGPEGGFSSKEIQLAKDAGFESISLGPRILKAETATLTACVLIQYLFGDLGQKNLDKE